MLTLLFFVLIESSHVSSKIKLGSNMYVLVWVCLDVCLFVFFFCLFLFWTAGSVKGCFYDYLMQELSLNDGSKHKLGLRLES